MAITRTQLAIIATCAMLAVASCGGNSMSDADAAMLALIKANESSETVVGQCLLAGSFSEEGLQAAMADTASEIGDAITLIGTAWDPTMPDAEAVEIYTEDILEFRPLLDNPTWFDQNRFAELAAERAKTLCE